MNSGISLTRTLIRPSLALSNEPQLLYLAYDMLADAPPAQAARQPVNLCLVIDRSSSMKGERLARVKEAAIRLIDQLDPADYFALVTFNDRAEVAVPAQRIGDRAAQRRAVNAIEAAGGTEMANSLALALQEIRRPLLTRAVHRILLLTDGRTYGDEGRCVEIARLAQSRGVGITALGIGTEWNEDLLETLAAGDNSRATFITSAPQVTQVFSEEVHRMHTLAVRKVEIRIETRPDCLVRSVDRVRPHLASVPVVEDGERRWVAALGDWPAAEPQTLIVELVVPPLPIGDHPLIRTILRYDVPGADLRDQQREDTLHMPVVSADQDTAQIDHTIRNWLERLTAYRLQASAWRNVDAGRLDAAGAQLKMAGTRLFNAGQTELAREVEREATRLLQSGSVGDEARKRIKFGTRGLISSEAAQRETGR